jgi:hypothetical protein
MSIDSGASTSPPQSFMFSLRTFSSHSGRSAMSWKIHVHALVVASWLANRNVSSVMAISRSLNQRISIAGFSGTLLALASPPAASTFSRYALLSSMLMTHRSKMQSGSPPAAMRTLLLAAQLENSRSTMSAAFLPYHGRVKGRMMGKLTSSSAAVMWK